jgi:LysM repeat protein
VLGLVAVALMGLGLVTAFAPSHGEAVGQRTVTVMPGQSAWDVARDVNPTVDPRVTVEAVTAANGLQSAGSIEPGQRLLVPVYAAR